MGVEPTERRFPDAPQALKARRVTGPYSLPGRILDYRKERGNEIRDSEKKTSQSS